MTYPALGDAEVARVFSQQYDTIGDINPYFQAGHILRERFDGSIPPYQIINDIEFEARQYVMRGDLDAETCWNMAIDSHFERLASERYQGGER